MTEDKDERFQKKARKYLKNTKNYLAKKTERTARILKKIIRKCRKKSSWVNIPVLLTNITSLLVFCSMSYMLAEYEGKEKLYIFSVIAIIITVLALIWETICLIGTGRFRKFSYYARSCPRRLIDFGRKYPFRTKAAIYMIRTVVIAAVVFHFCWHDTRYYASVQEVYGIPNGVGEPLSPEERRERAGYWKIEDYPFRKCVALTYVEGYGQMGLMRNYSTAYGMNLFETPARMVVTYEKDKEHYHFDWSVWQAAGRNRYRVPVQVRYYENEKLLLELERDKNDYGLFTITSYSGEDMPQLLGSTLLRVPDDERAEGGAVFPQIDVACSRGWDKGMTDRQIEVVYNADGLPQTRRLASRAGNPYGVNGEQYDYDGQKRLSRMYYIDADGNPICNKLGIMMVTFEYKNEKADRPDAIRYYGDMEGVKKTEGFYGVFCERFTYDDNGNVKERRQLDRSENWICDRNGVYQYTYDYDAGKLTKESFFGVDGKAVKDKRFHTVSVGFDRTENTITVFFDHMAAGTEPPEEVSISGTSAGGRENASKTFGEETGGRQYSGMREISASAALRMEPGAGMEDAAEKAADFPFGYEEEEIPGKYGETDAGMERAAENSGRSYTSVRYIIEENRIARAQYCGGDGEPAMTQQGYAAVRFDYDSAGHIVCEQYLDAAGELCAGRDGYAEIRHIYIWDEEIKEERVEYRMADGKLAYNRKTGYAYVRNTYGGDGGRTRISESFYDTQKEPVCLPGENYTTVERVYNENGLLTEETYRDRYGQSVCRADYGVAQILYEYSGSGNLIREWYRNEKGELANRTDTGYTVVHQEFENGQLTERRYEQYRDNNWYPVADKKTGAAIIRHSYDNGQRIRSEYYNAAGQPTLRHDLGCAARQYTYDSEGRLSGEYYYGTDGKAMISTVYHCAGTAYVYGTNGNGSADQETEIRYLGLDRELMIRSDKGYAWVKKEYDSEGRLSRESYYDTKGSRVVSSAYHCAGFEYKYDERGNKTEVGYIGLDGELMVRSDKGYAREEKKYDMDGNQIEGHFYDADGNPAVWKERGYASFADTYENGNLTETRCYDTEGNLTLRRDRGYAVARYGYDIYGQRISSRYYGTDEKPIISTSYHCAGFEYRYDERGNETEVKYIGLDGELMVRSDKGFAREEKKYDMEGNQVEGHFYDADGNPAVWKERGYASFTDTYENGNLVETRCYDTEGNLTLRRDRGYAVARYAYDSYGQCISSRYYEIDEMPIISTAYHCAGFDYEYDERGNETEVRYIGLDGELMVRSDKGFAREEKKYDMEGNQVEGHFYDADGNPAVWKERGYASFEDVYENGNVAEARCYDIEGNLTLRQDLGYAVAKYGHDVYGQYVSSRYYGIDEKPIISTEYHCAGFEYKYDERGNEVEVRYIGLDGKLMVRSDRGYAWEEKVYDADGNAVKGYFYDADGNPAVWTERGYASFADTYKNGNLIETRCYGIDQKEQEDKKLTLRRDRGYAVAKYGYDAYGKCIWSHYYGTDEERIISTEDHCAGFAYVYDERGNEAEVRYIGLDGKLMVRSDRGYAREEKKYDTDGNQVEGRFYDADGNPAVWKERGYTSFVDTYENGKLTETRCYDMEGNLTLRRDRGYAVARYGYDIYGQRIFSRYYGTDEEPIISTEYHCAGFEYSYDERGNQTEIYYIGPDGNLMMRDDLGYAWKKRGYDAEGNLLEEFCYNAEGILLQIFSYDAEGN